MIRFGNRASSGCGWQRMFTVAGGQSPVGHGNSGGSAPAPTAASEARRRAPSDTRWTVSQSRSCFARRT